MKVVAGFHTRDDEWILPLKLKVLSKFCDVIVVCLDRPSEGVRKILGGFPKVSSFEHVNTMGLPDHDDTSGPLCEEGAMRREVFDHLVALQPDFIILGDTDEIPTPDIIPFLQTVPTKYPVVDYFRIPIVNLFLDQEHYICGRDCVWSPEHERANKRGTIIRYNPSRRYHYEVTRNCHVPTEPFILDETPSGLAKTFVYDLISPRVLHYRFVNWARWSTSFKAGMKKYQDTLQEYSVKATPREWLWDLS